VPTVRNRNWGTWYLVPPGWKRPPEDASDYGFVESFEYGRSYLEAAIELWGLVGDSERVNQIEAVLNRAYQRSRSEPILNAADIDELIALLDGLADRLIGTVVDEERKIRREQLPELRRRTTMFDLDENAGYVVENALLEGIGRAEAVRDNLQHAREAGLEILLD
jgi:hypothetical protein